MAVFDVSQGGGSTARTASPTAPSGTQVGDLLLVTAMIDGSAALTPRCTVGTLIRTIGFGSPATFAAWVVAASVAGARVVGTISWDGTSRYIAWSVIRIPASTFAFDSSSPIAAAASQANATSRSMTFAGVSPSVAGCLDVLLAGIDQVASGTPPAGYTEQIDNSIGSYIATGDAPLAAGASGTKTVTLSAALETGTIRVAIAPATVAAKARSLLLLGVG